MKVSKFSRVLGLSAFMALFQPVGLHAATPQYDNDGGSDFVAFNVNDSQVRTDFLNNQQDLEKITSELDRVFADTQVRLQRIVISGYASPDGPYAKNAKLALARTNGLKEYVSRRYNLPASMIETRTVAEDWDGLEKYVAAATLQQLPNRDAMLQIIRSNRKADDKERVLRSKYPQDFQYLKDNCLPQLRRSEYQIVYQNTDNSNLSVADLLGAPQDDDDQTVEAQNLVAQAGTPIADDGITEIPAYDVPANTNEEYPELQPEPQPTTPTTVTVQQAVQQATQIAQKTEADLNDNQEGMESLIVDTDADYSQIVPKDKLVVSDETTHDSIDGNAQVRFIINEFLLRPDYKDNISDLDKITTTLDKVLANKNIRLRRIIITGYASPDGPYKFNEKLAYNRADTLRRLVAQRYELPVNFIEARSVAEDWQGLEQLVERASLTDLPRRDAILNVIRSNKSLAEKERILRSYKQDFNYLKENILPVLRRSEYYIEYIIDNRVVVLQNAPLVPVEEPKIVEVQEKAKKPWYLAVKTNLIYDAAIIPNIGVEAYLGKQWTVLGDWFYTWFKNDDHYRYWQGYGGYLGVRKYFGAKALEHPFTGHHVGAYGLMLTHDVEWGGRGYQMPKWGFGGGLEYGYSAPIARRLNLDFSVGVGYQDGKYYEYLPMDGHYVWQSTHKRHWFGPTKAEVSLVWLIGRGNYHGKKMQTRK